MSIITNTEIKTEKFAFDMEFLLRGLVQNEATVAREKVDLLKKQGNLISEMIETALAVDFLKLRRP